MTIWDRLTLALATGLGLGRLPAVPGTFGSLWGLLIGWGFASAELSPIAWAAATVGLCLMGVPICGRAAVLLGRPDPGAVVYDEFASLPLAFVAVEFTPTIALAGFVLFRILDMTKPWPISRAERLPRGWGIMADDIVAALLTAVLLWAAVSTMSR